MNIINDLKLISSLNEKIAAITVKIQEDLSSGRITSAIEKTFDLERYSERLVNISRLIPINTGDTKADQAVKDIILKESDIDIKPGFFLTEPIFYLKIPSLLPKKEKGDASYIRASLQTALRDYSLKHEIKNIVSEKSVIIFNHCYSNLREERLFRDHDNIEINVVIDSIALYCLKDDNPKTLFHFYCSSISDEDCTKIYIVPRNVFPQFISEGGDLNIFSI